MTKRQLQLYNTASRNREAFEPSGDVVQLYCCGPTVYDYAHIGNLRTYIWEDVLKRALAALGHKVRHVVNITDVGHLTSDEDTGEDKMEKGARREGRSVRDVAAHYTETFKKDFAALNLLEPDVWPRATEHVPEMIEMIKTLERKGFTYRTSDGVYFDTSKFPAYCDFARLDPESLRAGIRIDMGEKKSPTDFALWKFSPPDVRRQMEWKSPWGTGFPGWHIECSAMALKYLVQPLDIHCGGPEHVRVHHTNEIAQTEAATGARFARFWMHGEWLQFDSGKMSKSEGGTVMLEEIVKQGISPLAYRLFTYSAHYKSPLTFSWDGLRGAVQSLKNLKKHIAEIGFRSKDRTFVVEGRVDDTLAQFWDAVCDDLNMPKAMAAVWDLLRNPKVSDTGKLMAIARADAVLGLDLLEPDPDTSAEMKVERSGTVVTVKFNRQADRQTAERLADAVVARKNARAAKDFATADRIRGELTRQGVEVRDRPDGSTECVVP